MKTEPLFIKYANGLIDPSDIVQGFIRDSSDKKSLDIAKQTLKNLPDMSIFRRDFKKALSDLIDNGVNNYFVNYVNSYMKPSLEEIVKSTGNSQFGESRWVNIKESDVPWIEALLCYNLSLYVKIYGIKELKKCPICEKFFSNKGKYAKYCSDSCKNQGTR